MIYFVSIYHWHRILYLPSAPNISPGIWAEPAKNDGDADGGIVFVDQARLEARIYVPPLLLRLVPMCSATILRTIRNDMIPAIDRLVGAYRLWIDGQDGNVAHRNLYSKVSQKPHSSTCKDNSMSSRNMAWAMCWVGEKFVCARMHGWQNFNGTKIWLDFGRALVGQAWLAGLL